MRTDGHSAVAIAPDADFEARWTDWRAGGLAHEHAVRRKLILVVWLGGTVAMAVVIAYTLLRP